jgi:hypothetical protein
MPHLTGNAIDRSINLILMTESYEPIDIGEGTYIVVDNDGFGFLIHGSRVVGRVRRGAIDLSLLDPGYSNLEEHNVAGVIYTSHTPPEMSGDIPLDRFIELSGETIRRTVAKEDKKSLDSIGPDAKHMCQLELPEQIPLLEGMKKVKELLDRAKAGDFKEMKIEEIHGNKQYPPHQGKST